MLSHIIHSNLGARFAWHSRVGRTGIPAVQITASPQSPLSRSTMVSLVLRQQVINLPFFVWQTDKPSVCMRFQPEPKQELHFHILLPSLRDL